MNKKHGISTHFLNVEEAASYLGVSSGTIRRWAQTQELKGLKVGLRGDWRFTIDHLLQMANMQRIPSEDDQVKDMSTNQLTASPYIGNLKPSLAGARETDFDHGVQFYENDEFLLSTVKEFLSKGDAGIIISTPQHKEVLEKTLLETHNGHTNIFINVEEALDKFMIDNMPDSYRFFSFFNGLMERVEGEKIQVFGEMVSSLWETGNRAGAVQVEELWNDALTRHSFSILCAYPMNHFGEKVHETLFSEICTQHGKIFPTESYTKITSPDERLRAIVFLQQKAKALEVEMQKREDMEKAVRLSETRYRRLFEASQEGLLILDAGTGKIMNANPFMETLLEYEHEELINKNLYEIGLLHDLSMYNTLSQVLQEDHAIHIDDMEIETKKGKHKSVEMVANIYKEDKQMVIQCTVRDITRRKELELQKDEFLAVASHELKTPVTSLKAYGQALQKMFRRNGDERSAEFLEKMDTQINKLKTLIVDLLDITRIQAGKIQFRETYFDFNELLIEIVEEMQRTTDKHIIQTDLAKTRTIFADRDRTGQVITNLLSNAIKYSPDAEEIIVKSFTEGNTLTVYVQDFGMGMDQETQSKIFQRFYRGNEEDKTTFPGLGIGLYISQEIIRRQGGRMWVESEKGKGSTFCFSLPIDRDLIHPIPRPSFM